MHCLPFASMWACHICAIFEKMTTRSFHILFSFCTNDCWLCLLVAPMLFQLSQCPNDLKPGPPDDVYFLLPYIWYLLLGFICGKKDVFATYVQFLNKPQQDLSSFCINVVPTVTVFKQLEAWTPQLMTSSLSVA